MPEEEMQEVEVKTYRRLGKEEAAKLDCSKTCHNFAANNAVACAICDGRILYAKKEEE